MLLNGRDITDYLKQRHYQRVQGLPTAPRLAIINASSDPATASYLRAKQSYGSDIGVVVDVYQPAATTEAIIAEIQKLNADKTVDGIVVQLPLPETIDTGAVIEAITPTKDVDGLVAKSPYDPATPTGILWLLAGYNIDYKNASVAVVGQGRLVGGPLSQMLEDSGAQVIRCDEHTTDLASKIQPAAIIITAAGRPNLITNEMIQAGQVVIDAASDTEPSLQQRSDIKVTPTTGGVGPMTVAALFDNLLRAAEAK